MKKKSPNYSLFTKVCENKKKINPQKASQPSFKLRDIKYSHRMDRRDSFLFINLFIY